MRKIARETVFKLLFEHSFLNERNDDGIELLMLADDFTEDDKAKLLDYLTNDVGQRAVAQIPEEITAIVNEEISTYLGGAKDAKTCADVIQSRVNLWLAEHE